MDIRNKEDLWIAYSLVKLCEQHGNEELKHNAENLKRDIRKYTHRPASDRRYIDGDIDGYVAIIEFPLSADVSEEDAEEYFLDHEYIERIPSAYDCTGRSFTRRHKLFKRHGKWYCYHTVCIDC